MATEDLGLCLRGVEAVLECLPARHVHQRCYWRHGVTRAFYNELSLMTESAGHALYLRPTWTGRRGCAPGGKGLGMGLSSSRRLLPRVRTSRFSMLCAFCARSILILSQA